MSDEGPKQSGLAIHLRIVPKIALLSWVYSLLRRGVSIPATASSLIVVWQDFVKRKCMREFYLRRQTLVCS